MRFLTMGAWICSLSFSFLHSAVYSKFLLDGWSTHQPVLYAVAMSTTGPIIEFGCGFSSTNLLHDICAKEGRTLITLDDDLNWLNGVAQRFLGKGYNVDNSGWHKLFFVPGKKMDDLENPAHWVDFLEKFELLSYMEFAVCFIDQAPWLARYETVKRMKDKARFVVVHDVDYFPNNGIFGTTIRPIANKSPGEFDFSDVFSTFHVYFPNQPWPSDTGPPTLLGSNFEKSLPAVDYSQPIVIKN